MKVQSRLLLTCATGAFIMAMAPWAARAADQAMPVKAPVVVEEGWWWKGYIELGARGFLNDPKRNGVKGNGTGDSLAKFYEYRDLTPGAFGDGWFATGTKNGLYQLDGWAKNVGYTDQAYELNWSKAGEHYLTVDWDQIPHVISTSALTPYFGIGSNQLTLAPGVSNALFNAAGCTAGGANNPPGGAGCNSPLSPARAAAVQAILNGNLHQTDLGIRRDTGSVEYRYTPTDDWDVRVNYSLTHRVGSQVQGIAFSPGTSGVRVDAPKPVDDITQNYGASGEYVGTSPWSQRYTVKLGYSGSTYTDRWDSYTIQNPFCPNGETTVGQSGFCARTASPSTPTALVSLWPDNQANGGTATLGADLPYKSRYMGTVSYNVMTQNAPFLPFTLSPTVITNSGNTTSGAAPTAMPASSLNGQINTLLSNNVLTTEITPTLKNKASYRYYNYDNGTPILRFADWVVTDAKLATVTGANNAYAPNSSISPAYTKQSAGDEIVWRPWNGVNLGAVYNWERYDWQFESVNQTNEHSGKVFADWTPWSDLTVRSSWLAAFRRYENYDYVNNIATTQFPGVGTSCTTGAGGCSTRMVSGMRDFYLNNRDRNKGQIQVDWQAAPRLTISPTAGVQLDEYIIDPYTQIGLTSSRSWRAGLESTYILDPRTSFLVSYMYEEFQQKGIFSAATGTGNPFIGPTGFYRDTIADKVHTVVAGVNWTAIPDRLDFRFNYAVSFAIDDESLVFNSGAGPATGPYPTVKNVWQRFDASAKYRFDPDWVHSLGWKGDVYAKLLYAWERNSANNWANDVMQNYMFNVQSSTGYMTWMAFDNPNYNVHMLAGAIGFSW
jgi:MtrB/PioB family decaheme-associated outer membrane protein